MNKIELAADTSITGVWDGHGRVITINNYKIHGTGTIVNWDIDASVNQVIFDTSINLKNITTSRTPFSTVWYGTKPGNRDNWWNVQKSINVCMDNHLECFTPGKGIYHFSKPLEFSKIVNNSYQQCYIHFYGDASIWDNGQGTTFQYTGTTGAGMNAQLNKGTELNNFVLFGLWKSPTTADSLYFNTAEANYKDASGHNLADNYTGISIDGHKPVDGITNSGSTGIHIHEVGIGGFGMLLAISQNGITANDDIMRVENLHLYDGKYGIVGGQAQEKDMRFSGIFSWGRIYEIINVGLHGKSQAGEYSFDGMNIAGYCVQVFDISIGHWYSTHINRCFAENIGRIGNFSAQMPITIDNSNFDLCFFIGKNRVVINSNSYYVAFTHCTIRYYDGLINDIWVHGYMTFDALCYFGGGKLLYK